MTARATRSDGSGEIAIYTGRALQVWGPGRITAPGGLGGSETAAARVAAELAGLGHDVVVYGMVTPGVFDGVPYKTLDEWDPAVRRRAVISSRQLLNNEGGYNAGASLLWMHDHSYGNDLTAARAEHYDRVLVLSEWHEGTIGEQYPFLAPERFRRIRNGIEPSFFTDDAWAPADRDPARVTFSSGPDRGLAFLLRVWPHVLERVPEATLGFCFADIYNQIVRKYPLLGGYLKKVRRQAEELGVVDLGSLGQGELARRMRSSGVWVHPSYHSLTKQRFHETFCIGAVEAAAAGCALVMSPWGALTERDDLPEECRYVGELTPEAWADAIAGAIAAARERGPFLGDWAVDPSWRAVTHEILAVIDEVTGDAARAGAVASLRGAGR